MILTRDFDGRYVQMAPGDKAKCMFYADDRVFGWVFSGAVKITIDGQEPKVLPRGWAFNLAPRLSSRNCRPPATGVTGTRTWWSSGSMCTEMSAR